MVVVGPNVTLVVDRQEVMAEYSVVVLVVPIQGEAVEGMGIPGRWAEGFVFHREGKY